VTHNADITNLDLHEKQTNIPSNLAERIRTDILVGAYRPGEWLRQMNLQETCHAPVFKYGVH
jgi:DNA-binding GntR family transcriptional regulator|tara:strand:- start:109601 stop:109786 length:186 start_codon:yes stop_codon:yes gene_type:complete